MGALDDDVDPARNLLLGRALTLSYVSVAWGLIAGVSSITAGLLAGSLGVLGLGLNVLADVAGSIGLIWRFGVERRDPKRGLRAEARASIVVAAGLGLVAITLTVAAIFFRIRSPNILSSQCSQRGSLQSYWPLSGGRSIERADCSGATH